MTVEAARLYRFNAVHSLPGFPKPWSLVHGHRYTVELIGSFNHEQADEMWAEIRSVYDHRNLNEVGIRETTVENLAEHFLYEFEEVEGIRRCTVWEDDDRWGRATR